MGAREEGLRRVAMVTTGIALAGVAGATLVAYTVSGGQQNTSPQSNTSFSSPDGNGQFYSGGTGVSPGFGPAHGHSGGS
jgi:hypothetical protein